MKLKRSEIFEAFEKLAIDQGLIEVTAEAMTQEDKYRNSEWKDAIQALYGINPDENKEDLLDRAHPEPVIIAPSYDKVNGLVENLKERHDIMVGIVNKQPNGFQTSHKYAEVKNDLLKKLISLGFDLDNKDIDDLRVLADSCSERLVKKSALPALALPAGAVALVAGLTALINNTQPSDQGIVSNIQRAIEYIEEAKDEAPQAKSHLNELLEDLKTLQDIVNKYMSLEKVDISTADKFKEVVKNKRPTLDVASQYIRACTIMSQRLPKYIELLQNTTPQTSSWGQFFDKLRDFYHMFDPGDLKEAILALETLQDSLIKSIKEAKYYMQLAKFREPSLIAALEKSLDKPEPSKESKKLESFPTAPVYENEADEFVKDQFGG